MLRCNQCKGSGKIPIPLHLSRVLDIVSRGPTRSEDVARALGIGPTAACNRLMTLLNAGLLVRERDGHAFVWRLSDH